MRPVYVDATTLIALGTVGELELLENFGGRLAVPDPVREEVTTEPGRTNVERFCSRESVRTGEDVVPGQPLVSDARTILDEAEVNGDVVLVGAVLEHTENAAVPEHTENAAVPEHTENAAAALGVVSDDSRVRTVAEGLGATVTGTVGVIVRAVHEGLDPGDAKELVRRIDSHGLHMTGELRETAFRLVEEAADEQG
jgi:predicted nucleic acid-binding protein